MSVLERRRVILLAVVILGLVACRPVDPALELIGRGVPLESPLATDSALGSPLDTLGTGLSPLQIPGAALPDGSVPVVIVHTNDTWGYYDPCG